jgi:hypothetical protein
LEYSAIGTVDAGELAVKFTGRFVQLKNVVHPVSLEPAFLKKKPLILKK